MFSIIFSVSAAARKTAFERDGQIWPETFTLKIDPAELTPQQRALILSETGLPTNEGAGVRAMVFAEGRDLQALIAALEKEAAVKAHRKAREDENKAAKLQQAREAAEEYISGKMPMLYIGCTQYPTTGDAELDAAVVAEKTRREEKIKQDEADRKAAIDAKWQEMAEWAKTHGSNHLQRLIEGGYNWKEKCVSEWIAAHTPDGWADISKDPDFVDWWQIKNPTEYELDALGAARAEYPDGQVDLYRVKFNEPNGEIYHNDYLSMSINPPIGEGVTVEKWVAAY